MSTDTPENKVSARTTDDVKKDYQFISGCLSDTVYRMYMLEKDVARYKEKMTALNEEYGKLFKAESENVKPTV